MICSEKNRNNNSKEDITVETVEYIAELAKIHLDEADKEPFTKELRDIVDFAEQINELKVDEIDMNNSDNGPRNVFRKDMVESSFNREEMLKNAPKKTDGCLVAPKIMD